MQEGQETILRHLGKVLHAYVDDITHEPVPRRWADLILYLDEEERRHEQDRQLEIERNLPKPTPRNA
jgi:hypothetical protein